MPELLKIDYNNQEDVMTLVTEGHRNRRVGSHEMNMDSSRSHCRTNTSSSLAAVADEAERSQASMSRRSFS